jgi:hypothetical protein
MYPHLVLICSQLICAPLLGCQLDDEWKHVMQELHRHTDPEADADSHGANGAAHAPPYAPHAVPATPFTRRLSEADFAEVLTIELGEGVYFTDYAPLVWQARLLHGHSPHTHTVTWPSHTTTGRCVGGTSDRPLLISRCRC